MYIFGFILSLHIYNIYIYKYTHIPLSVFVGFFIYFLLNILSSYHVYVVVLNVLLMSIRGGVGGS